MPRAPHILPVATYLGVAGLLILGACGLPAHVGSQATYQYHPRNPNAVNYHLAGVVLDDAGAPMNGVALTIRTTRFVDSYSQVFTDRHVVDSSFSVSDTEAIRLSLLFEKPGYERQVLEFRGAGNGEQSLTTSGIKVILRRTAGN